MGPHLPLNVVTSVQRFDGRDLGRAPISPCWAAASWATSWQAFLCFAFKTPLPRGSDRFLGQRSDRRFRTCPLRRRPALNWRISWDKPHTDNVEKQSLIEAIANAATQRRCEAGPLDLAINCDGFNPLTQTLTSWLQPAWVAGGCLRADGRAPLPWGDLPQQRFLADPDWDSPAFLDRYAKQFTSNYIAELLCRVAFLEPNADDLGALDLPWEEPPFEVPSILIHTTTTRAAKIWPFQAWETVLKWCASRSKKLAWWERHPPSNGLITTLVKAKNSC